MKKWVYFIGIISTGVILVMIFFVITKNEDESNEYDNSLEDIPIPTIVKTVDGYRVLNVPKEKEAEYLFGLETEPGETFNDRSFKVFQVINDIAALVRGKDEYGNYSGMIYFLVGDSDATFYDDQIIKVPRGKSARMVGTYKYTTKSGEHKTVPKIRILDQK